MTFEFLRPDQSHLGFLLVHASLPQCPSTRPPMFGFFELTLLDPENRCVADNESLIDGVDFPVGAGGGCFLHSTPKLCLSSSAAKSCSFSFSQSRGMLTCLVLLAVSSSF